MLHPLTDHFNHIQAAHTAIRPYCHRTPILTSDVLNKHTQNQLFFKCENLQKTGSFKVRGALNAVRQLPPITTRIITYSSGNHATALSYAARIYGKEAHILIPSDATPYKKNRVSTYTDHVYLIEPNEREVELARLNASLQATFIPPYNHLSIIYGQATAAVELLEDQPHLEMIIVPLGGGGLLSGTLLAAKYLRPDITVIGVEPRQANEAAEALRTGQLPAAYRYPPTIADGLRAPLGDITFSLIRPMVDQLWDVSEAQIWEATTLIWDTLKIVVEPSSAVGLAALLAPTSTPKNQRIGLILTGGNIPSVNSS